MITQFEYDEIQRDIKTDKFEPESPSVIQAIIEAKEVLKSTQLTPRQLLGALQEAKSTMEEEHISYGKPGAWEPESYKIICRALSKTSKEGV